MYIDKYSTVSSQGLTDLPTSKVSLSSANANGRWSKSGEYGAKYRSVRPASKTEEQPHELGNARGLGEPGRGAGRSRGRRPGLLAHCRRWTLAEPGNGVPWSGLVYAYTCLGRHPESREAYRGALRPKPDFAYAWGNLAHTYAKIGNRALPWKRSRSCGDMILRRRKNCSTLL